MRQEDFTCRLHGGEDNEVVLLGFGAVSVDANVSETYTAPIFRAKYEDSIFIWKIGIYSQKS